jgi:hypothetical protein
VTLNFNFPDYNGGSFNITNNFALLYNATDGTFATGTNQLVTTLSTTTTASIVSFKVTASSIANGYYTILYSSSPISLPVTLSGFTAYAQGRTAVLQWTTAAQSGFGSFTVERSGDGRTFSAVGTITADTNTNQTEQYSFTDTDPLPGMNYYRLAMVDPDGRTSWSAIHLVSFTTGAQTALFTIYPNPVADRLHLVLADAGGPVAVRLYNIHGQLLLKLNAVASGTLDIPMDGFARGIYFVAVDGALGNEVRKVILR